MKTKGVKLDAEQRQAVEATTRKPVVVLAGPGSGKTTVLAHRYEHLVENEDLSPDNILAVTFTVKMAEELAERIMLKVPNANRYQISTIHAFALRTLKDLGVVSKKAYKVKDWIVRSVIETVSQERGWTKSPRSIRWWIEQAKNDGVPITDEDLRVYFSSKLLQAGGTSYDVECLISVALAFDSRLKADNCYTFPDILNLLWQTVQSPEQLKRIRSRIKYILVDEGQDTSELSVKILRRIQPNAFFIVGDPDQMLFRFNGSAPEKNLFQVAQEGTVYKLQNNYRSTPQIVRAAGALIGHNYSGETAKFSKSFSTKNADGPNVQHQVFGNVYEEADWVVSRLSNPGDAFVCARTNAQLSYVERSLMMNNVPYIVLGSRGFFSEGYIQDVLDILRLAVDETNDTAFDNVYDISSPNMRSFNGDYAPTRYLGNKFLEECHQSSSCMTAVRRRQYSNRFRRGATDLLDYHKFLVTKLRSNPRPVDIQSLIISGYLKYRQARAGLQTVDPGSDNVVDDLESLQNMAHNFRTVKEWLTFVHDMEARETAKDETGRVILSTIHAIKGRERPTVFGVGLSEGLLPHRFSLGDRFEVNGSELPIPPNGSVEDERCAAFVLITRAKQEVNLSSILEYNNRELVPSRFISEMGLVK